MKSKVRTKLSDQAVVAEVAENNVEASAACFKTGVEVMSRGMSAESKFLIGSAAVGLGVVGLYYLTAGWGREKDAALIPDALEDRLDMVVEALNGHVGKEWVDRGADGLKKTLRTVLPGPLVALVDVVHAVEVEATRQQMSGSTKQRRAQATAAAWGLA